jgi:hypothetical protein
MLIALGIYLYLWLNFHWKTTGVSKHQEMDAPMSKNTSESATDHYARVFNNKFGLLRIGIIIIIFGRLGTLQDRWNIWTFGIKIYNKHNNPMKIICEESYTGIDGILDGEYVFKYSINKITKKPEWLCNNLKFENEKYKKEFNSYIFIISEINFLKI